MNEIETNATCREHMFIKALLIRVITMNTIHRYKLQSKMEGVKAETYLEQGNSHQPVRVYPAGAGVWLVTVCLPRSVLEPSIGEETLWSKVTRCKTIQMPGVFDCTSWDELGISGRPPSPCLTHGKGRRAESKHESYLGSHLNRLEEVQIPVRPRKYFGNCIYLTTSSCSCLCDAVTGTAM